MLRGNPAAEPDTEPLVPSKDVNLHTHFFAVNRQDIKREKVAHTRREFNRSLSVVARGKLYRWGVGLIEPMAQVPAAWTVADLHMEGYLKEGQQAPSLCNRNCRDVGRGVPPAFHKA